MRSSTKRTPKLTGRRLFALFVIAITPTYLILIIDRAARSGSRDSNAVQRGLFDRCVEICRAYGLLSSGDIARDADAYLDAVKSRPLPADLQQLLRDPGFQPAPSQLHSLRGQTAPDFKLPDHLNWSHSLTELNRKGPVVVVFYYGYWCSHCVAQLFALNKDVQHFTDLGATIVAISADPPEQTLARFVQYGKFDFPVLSDADNAVAEQWSVFTPGSGGTEPRLDHGTFVVDANGRVVWAYQGAEPFTDNRSLLTILADLQGMRPQPEIAATTKAE